MKFALAVTLLSAAAAQAQSVSYEEALTGSLLFYEAQRSGKLPDNNRIDWRADSALDDMITEGYYDAGDHVKFGFPMASMTTQLAWGAVTWQSAYESSGETQHMRECLEWSTDYFQRAHTSANEFYGQVGDGDADHAFWGRPEDMTMSRPAFKIDANSPGSDLAGETAAALAASSMFYSAIGESALANASLAHAAELFAFADEHRDVYTNAIPAGNFYNSWSGYNDELVWSAAWMAKATGDSSYTDRAEALYNEFGLADIVPTEFSWDNKVAGAQVLLYDLTGDSKYESAVNAVVDYVLNQARYTPKGLVYVDDWGSLRHAGNLAHLCLQIAELGLRESECRSFAQTQVDYILGNANSDRSFVVGMGSNPPERPHHRASSCNDMPAQCGWDDFNNPGPNPQTLTGALVGGPNGNDEYQDDRDNFQNNEVATDYNAGYQSALAGLI